MKNYRIFIFIFVLVLLNACRTDEFEENPESNPIPMETTTSVEGNLNGIVIDANLRGIEGAEVYFDGKTVTTDEYGIFRITDALALTTGSLVTIDKPGYYKGYKFTTFEPGKDSHLKITMVEKEVINSFSSSEEAIIDVNGAELRLPAGITTTQDGTPYTGIVNVQAYWYDPTEENTITEMPGDLRGVDANGVAVQLTTYGMMVVELLDDSGAELALNEAMKATLTFPLPQAANAPSEIPMWHLNETTGAWEEEGIANRIGNAMVAEVSHFSFWNCDVPFDLVILSGRVITRPGNTPVAGLQVIVTDNDAMISGYAYTNSQGIFSGLVPAGNDLTLSIFSCGEIINVSALGNLSSDTDLGDISIEAGNLVLLKANLVDCEGETVLDGGGIITTENSLDFVYVNQGTINFLLFPCSDNNSFQGFDNTTGEFSEPISFEADNTVVDLEEVEVCEDEVVERIEFLGGDNQPIVLGDAEVTIVDDKVIHIYAEVPNSNPAAFYELVVYIEGQEPDPGENNVERWATASPTTTGFATASDDGRPDGLEVITGSQVGDIIRGSHTSGEFILRIDKSVSSVTVTGTAWIDDNEDGLRDVTENTPIPASLKDLLVLPRIVSASNQGFWYYYRDFTLNDDGSYSFKGMPNNLDFSMIAKLIPYNTTLFRVGNDRTIDSDFDEFNRTMTFNEEGGTVIPNIGLGIIL